MAYGKLGVGLPPRRSVSHVLGWLPCVQVMLDERGAIALSRLLEATPTLQQLELCRQVDLAVWVELHGSALQQA
jgi:hypothetical protein